MSDPDRKTAKAAAKAAAEAKYQETISGLPSFSSFGKIPRLNRDICITEKIDGTNAAIGIGAPLGSMETCETSIGTATWASPGAGRVWAQSRTRLITPEDDNYGFAAWVQKHADVLTETLGPGLHFGEWMGVGINRNYGLTERRFYLFNSARWAADKDLALARARHRGVAIYATPVLYEGPWVINAPELFDFAPNALLNDLRTEGSRAIPGFMNPEGIVVFHKAGNLLLKVTCEGDEKPKGQPA